MAPSERRRRLIGLIAARAIISTLLLGSGVLVLINAPGSLPVNPFYFLIGLAYALTAVYAALLPYADRWPWLADVQVVSDVLVISGFIVITGGVTSYFSLLYVLPIIAASTLLRQRGALAVGVLASLMYAGVVLLQYLGYMDGASRGLLEAQVLPPARVAQYTVAINVFTFLAVALLSGSLAGRVMHAGASLERASTELANLQAFSQDVIDSLTSGLVTTDVNGRILSVNRAAVQIAGHPLEAMAGRDVGEVLNLPPPLRRALANDLDGQQNRRAEYLYTTGAGRTIDLGLSVGYLMTPGGKMGFLVTFQDITEMKRLERDARLRQRLAAVGEMAAGIAHEIRNPLASMAGSIQVLREELSLNEDQAQLMDIVLRESKRLNETIRSFLAYARPQRVKTERIDLRKTVSDTVLLLRNSAEVQPCHAVQTRVSDEPVWCEADEGQIRQILWNLATNGLRAMPTGGRLRLSATREPAVTETGEAVGLAAVLEVQDDGVGIPPEEIDDIFHPFRGTFSRGSGLGLAIVHRIVSDYNGTIQVNSAPGQGTTVSVRLPLDDPSS